MRYALVHGEAESTIIRQCIKSGQPLPKAIANSPELDLGLETVYFAFWELSTSRNVGFGVGCIPIGAVYDYIRFHEIPYEEQQDFIHLIRVMDKEFCKFQDEKSPKPKPAKGKGRG